MPRMLKSGYLKTAISIILALYVVSIYLSNQVIHTVLLTETESSAEFESNVKGVEGFTDKPETTVVKKVPYNHYSHPYIAGCNMFTSEELWKEIVPGFVYILSVFYDNRSSPPYVRMIAAVLSGSQHDLWCHFVNTTSNSLSTKVLFQEMPENHNLPFGGWILSCEVPKAIVSLCGVMLSTAPRADTITVKMIHLTTFAVDATLISAAKPRQRFSVCVPPVFGNIPVRRLVEFMETVHYLGADKIFLHVMTNDSTIHRVLRYYEMKEYAVLLPWQLPFNDVIVKNLTSKRGAYTIKINSIWYNGQILAANDCLYRTMPNFDFTVFSDLDEALVPGTDHYNWEDIIQKIRTENASGYSFKSAYFKPDSKDSLKFLSHVRTSQVSPTRYKVMVHPERVIEVGIHHISRSVQNKRKYTTEFVDEHVAKIHHFRKCQKEINLNCSDTVVDSTMRERYGHVLRRAVSDALDEIERLQSHV